jgi:membrane protease YdiL (CAAX protease family)
MSIQNFGTTMAAGLQYLPYAIAAQGACLATGIIANWVTLDTVREAYFPSPSSCVAVVSMPLLQKITMVGTLLTLAALEEFSFGFMQDRLLTRAPRMFFSLFGRGRWADSLIARTARSVLTALAFSTYHPFMNKMMLAITTDPQMKDKLSDIIPADQIEILARQENTLSSFQFVNTFGPGLVFAAIKEKTGSVWPALGLHGAWNTLLPSMTMLQCAMQSSNLEETQIATASKPQTTTALESCKPELCTKDTNSSFCHASNQRLIKKAGEWDLCTEVAKTIADFKEDYLEEIRPDFKGKHLEWQKIWSEKAKNHAETTKSILKRAESCCPASLDQEEETIPYQLPKA